MKNKPLFTVLLGVLISFFVVGAVAGVVYAVQWWNTPLSPSVDGSTLPTQDIDLDISTITPRPTTDPARENPSPTPTETPAPTETRLPTYTPSPTVVDQPDPLCGGPATMTILVTGVNSTHYVYGLSDAIRIVRVDFMRGEVTVLPLPRDLWVDIPVSIPGKTQDITPGKLNQGYYYGSPNLFYYRGEDQSPGLLAETLEYNFDLKVDRYLSVNTQVFRKMVDEIGGITVTLPRNVYGHHLDEPVLYMKAGTHHLNGKQAEMIARHRKLIGDFGRMKNQTLLLKAFMRELLSPQGLKELPGLIDIYRENVLMNFTPNEISKLLCLAARMDMEEDVTFADFPKRLIDSARIYDEVLNYDASTLVYDRNEMRTFFAEFQAGVWP